LTPPTKPASAITLAALPVGRDPPGLAFGEQLGRRSYRPTLPIFAIIVLERGGLSGSKIMEWFKRKTTIAGYQVSNWIIVLGAIIIVLLIFQNSH
jgi:hypothetical protein